MAGQYTDAHGLYLFEGLDRDTTYMVRVDEDTVTDGFVCTYPPAGDYDEADFGYDDPATASIGDFIYDDVDGDAPDQTGDSGTAGISVILTDADGNVVDIQETDASGNYLFQNLKAGTYTVDSVEGGLPEGYVKSPSTAADTVDITVDFGEADLSADFGFKICETGSIGNYLWDDTDGDCEKDTPTKTTWKACRSRSTTSAAHALRRGRKRRGYRCDRH